MSGVAMFAQNGSEKVAVRKLLWAAPLAGVAAAAANLAVFWLAGAALRLPLALPAMGPSPAGPLGAGQVIMSSFVPALGAGVLLALLARFFARPVRLFQIAAGVFLVLSLGAPLTLPLDLASRAALASMHVVAGLVITGLLSGLAAE